MKKKTTSMKIGSYSKVAIGGEYKYEKYEDNLWKCVIVLPKIRIILKCYTK